MYKVIGFCDLHHSPLLGELTETRALASTSFLGRYAFIDFTLSNFSNSLIDEVGILLKEHPRSLIKHLGFGDAWNINTKLGRNSIMYNERVANNPRYNHNLANIRENEWMLNSSKAKYVVVAPVHFVMSIDYRKVIEQHIENNAEITMVYKRVDDARNHFDGCDALHIENGLVRDIKINKGACDKANISLETYVISRKKFEELMKLAFETSAVYSLKDIIEHVLSTEKVHAYEFTGIVRCFDSLAHYKEYSLELLNYRIRQQLFLPDWPIHTITHDTPPTKYGKTSKVCNSFIANGAIINGKVENSIISRKVVISKGAVVTNSIILTDCIVGENAILDHVVMDKYARILRMKDLKGKNDRPLYVKQGDII